MICMFLFDLAAEDETSTIPRRREYELRHRCMEYHFSQHGSLSAMTTRTPNSVVQAFCTFTRQIINLNHSRLS
jgi:hypothetical protein